MHQFAEKLNGILKDTCAYSLLSDYGKRMYVPNGIIVQSAEAKQKATQFNATAGIAKEKGNAMYIPSMKAQFAPSLSVGEIFPYAPMGGVAALRKLWKEQMYKKNQSLEGKAISLPIVVSGLTNALSIVFSLFVDPSDYVILPDMYWENYDLIIDEQRQANKVLFPFFKKGGFNLEGLDAALASTGDKKTVVLLNFPNNPTGYTPTWDEASAIVELLKRYSDSGKKLTIISDDAYFGLFFEEKVCKESLFSRLCDCSENLLAIKCDAATKEEMVWGFRLAFITYGGKGFTEEQYDALMQKTMGVVRGSISSCSNPGQNILLNGMCDSNHQKDKEAGVEKICARYKALKKALEKYEGRKDLVALPFNSGYFMTFYCACDAEKLRQLLLNKYGTGVIRFDEHHIRLAFSSVDLEKVEALVDTVYRATQELLA